MYPDQRFRVVAVGFSFVFAHRNQFLFQFFGRAGFFRLKDQDADIGRRRLPGSGAPVAIGIGKIANGHAAHEVFNENAIFDDGKRGDAHTFFVNLVTSDQ